MSDENGRKKKRSAIGNKIKRGEEHQKDKRAKAQAKLKRRMAQRKAELADPSLRDERLKANVPRTVENTKVWGGLDAETGQVVDPRTVPVKVLQGEQGEMTLDLAGMEALFPDEEQLRLGPAQNQQQPDTLAIEPNAAADLPQDDAEMQPEASTSQLPAEEQADLQDMLPLGRVLITTAPRPTKPTLEFCDELQSLLGGNIYAEIIPRKNARFELSKVCAWAAKRNFRALIVVGEDHKEPSSITLTKLPVGPTAHFRLTSVQSTTSITGHAAPTRHAPELVLSNMSTPLGLSVGRLLQSLFPPLPQLEGRQVVAVHNQRDFIFFRRFRYMFALRSDDPDAKKWAKERGMDEDVRTRMQEIGPRMTLKLRWIKKGTLVEGRRKAGGQIIGHPKGKEKAIEAAENVEDQDSGDDEQQTAEIDPEAAEQLAEEVPAQTSESQDVLAATESDSQPKPKKRKRHRTHDADGNIRIPKLSIDEASLATNYASGGSHRMPKRKKGASILDGLTFQGGMRDEHKEWQWTPKMQVKKNRFYL